MKIKIKCVAVETSDAEQKKRISFSSTEEGIPGSLYLTVDIGSTADTFEEGEQFTITFEDVIE